MAIKAVLDSNIWISAIIKGKMADLLGIAVTYDVEFIRCKELSDEIRKVLGIKKFEQYLTEPVSHYVSVFESATTTVRIRHEFSGCRDPKETTFSTLPYRPRQNTSYQAIATFAKR